MATSLPTAMVAAALALTGCSFGAWAPDSLEMIEVEPVRVGPHHDIVAHVVMAPQDNEQARDDYNLIYVANRLVNRVGVAYVRALQDAVAAPGGDSQYHPTESTDSVYSLYDQAAIAAMRMLAERRGNSVEVTYSYVSTGYGNPGIMKSATMKMVCTAKEATRNSAPDIVVTCMRPTLALLAYAAIPDIDPSRSLNPDP